MKIKNVTIIRILSGLTFLIFFCPFFQMCSDESIKNAPFTKDILANPEIYTKKELQEFKKNAAIENKKRILETKKETTFNAYEIVYKPLSENDNFLKVIHENLAEIDTYGVISIVFFILNSIMIFVFTFLKKNKILIILNTINIVLIVSSLLFFFLKKGLLEDINQIKIGYYLFFINTLVIIYFCNQELKTKT